MILVPTSASRRARGRVLNQTSSRPPPQDSASREGTKRAGQARHRPGRPSPEYGDVKMEWNLVEWLPQMEDLLQTLNEGVLIVDKHDGILFANQCMEELVGVPAAEMGGTRPAAFTRARTCGSSTSRSRTPWSMAGTATSSMCPKQTDRRCR